MKTWQLILIGILFIATAILIVCLGTYKNKQDAIIKKEESKTEAVSTEEPQSISTENTEEQLKINEPYDISSSKSLQSEKEANQELSSRGFTQEPITYDYSIDGDYIREHEAINSDDKHPIYTTSYISVSNELWTVTAINGSVVASPVSYNLQSNRNVELIVSETDVVTSYDSDKNQFYERIPDKSELLVITVEKIDDKTLDSLTINVLDNM